MKDKVAKVVRILMGLIFVVFGLNGFLQFIAVPPPGSPEAGQFMMGLGAAGYFFPLLKITEIACGIALLANCFAPLALTVLAPIVLNIFLYHLVVDGNMSGMPMPVFLLVGGIFLATTYKSSYASLLRAKA